ncbi:MAG: formylmethanofuran dehydrogenase subunit C [Bacillota bacterium]
MNNVVLTLKREPEVPVDADALVPENFVEAPHNQICFLKLAYGNELVNLGDLFEVQGEKSDTIILNGNLQKFKNIGNGMSLGQISIYGNAGMHLGAGMKAGVIEVNGQVGDWLGAQMTGGTIIVMGSCGNMAGAAYCGEQAGMNGGSIIVYGRAGSNVGERMRRGLVIIKGEAGDFAGCMMLGGTLVLAGGCGYGVGAQMSRGSIISLEEVEILPTFHYCCTYEPVLINLLANSISRLGLNINLAEGWAADNYRRYMGDITELGKGELLVWERS